MGASRRGCRSSRPEPGRLTRPWRDRLLASRSSAVGSPASAGRSLSSSPGRGHPLALRRRRLLAPAPDAPRLALRSHGVPPDGDRRLRHPHRPSDQGPLRATLRTLPAPARAAGGTACGTSKRPDLLANGARFASGTFTDFSRPGVILGLKTAFSHSTTASRRCQRSQTNMPQLSEEPVESCPLT